MKTTWWNKNRKRSALQFTFAGFLFLIVAVGFQNCGSGFTPDSSSSSSASSIGTGTGSGSGGNTGPIPAAASALSATAPTSAAVNLSWTDNSIDEDGFQIERATLLTSPFAAASVGPYTLVGTVAQAITTFSDTSVQASMTYYYRVVAFNASGASQPTDSVMVVTPAAATTVPVGPSLLTATATAATVVTLTWMDNSNNEAYFKVERSSDNGTTFTLVGDASANSVTFEDINLTAATAYTYRVIATNSVGDSTSSNNAAVTTLAAGNTATYSYVNANIITPDCVSCHNATTKSGGYDFSTYALLSANKSAAISAINTNMPPGAPLTATQIGQVNSWINAGAPND